MQMMLPVSDIRINHHFVLIHGIGGGAWCWYKLKCLMENSGFRVTCLDLKSAGIDPTDPNDVLTFEEYNEPLVNMLQELPESERVMNVEKSFQSGSSAKCLSDLSDWNNIVCLGNEGDFGGAQRRGLSVTRACGLFKDKILLAIYVGATMLRNGLCTTEDIKIDSNLAALLLKLGPLQAVLGAKFDQGSPVDAVPRVFIKTVQDRVIIPEQQDAMIEKWPPENVYSIDSDHSPFLSAPFLLLGLLVKATASLPTI